MEQYIHKDALVAEIERIKEMYCYDTKTNASFVAEAVINSINNAINSIEVKEVDLQEEPKTEWLQEFQNKLDSLSKEDFEKVMAKYRRYGEEGSVDYDKLNTMLDESLSKETRESWNKRLGEEPVSEDLEEEIEEYWKNAPTGTVYFPMWEHFQIIAHHFAEWGKKQAEIEIQAQSMALAHGCPKKSVSECLEKAAEQDVCEVVNTCSATGIPNDHIPLWVQDAMINEFIHGANWKEQQFEKNRLKHCDSITNEQAELEQKFVDQHLDKYQRMPTFLDAIEYGMRLKEEQMMKNTADATIGLPYENKDGGYTHLVDVSRPLPVGDNKIAIIFKEE